MLLPHLRRRGEDCEYEYIYWVGIRRGMRSYDWGIIGKGVSGTITPCFLDGKGVGKRCYSVMHQLLPPDTPSSEPPIHVFFFTRFPFPLSSSKYEPDTARLNRPFEGTSSATACRASDALACSTWDSNPARLSQACSSASFQLGAMGKWALNSYVWEIYRLTDVVRKDVGPIASMEEELS